jgi:hypothetical protein
VLDGVIVHELAHLSVPGHTAQFHELANRYPLQAKVHTYLEGFSLGLATAGCLLPDTQDQPLAAQDDSDVAACPLE